MTTKYPTSNKYTGAGERGFNLRYRGDFILPSSMGVQRPFNANMSALCLPVDAQASGLLGWPEGRMRARLEVMHEHSRWFRAIAFILIVVIPAIFAVLVIYLRDSV